MNNLAHKHTKIEQDKHLRKTWEDDKGLCNKYFLMCICICIAFWGYFGPVLLELWKNG